MKHIGFSLIAALAFVQSAMAAEANWLTDLSKAQSLAKQEKKMVLIDFTGSDWCQPCIALHKNVLTAKEFVSYAKDNLVLVMVDFPRKKKIPAAQEKANDALLKKFNIEGYPTLVFLDETGNEVSRESGYESNRSVKEFVAKLKNLKKTS